MSDPFNLLWVFPTFEIGGAQRRFASLVPALGGVYRHSVVSLDGAFGAAELLPPDMRPTRLDLEVMKSAGLSFSNIQGMRALIRQVRPDLVLTTNFGAIECLAATVGLVPNVHFEDGFGPSEAPFSQNPKRVWARRALFRTGKRAFVAPSHLLEHVYREVWKTPQRHLHRIANGVDLERFFKVSRPTRTPVIGTVAALRDVKRIDRLISIFAASAPRNARLLIVGDGEERAALEAQAAPLGNRVEFVGAQSDVAPFLARMDVFALTSDTEQMPISLVEAMATGLPVVSTDVGDVSRMVSENNRRFVSSLGDDSALQDALTTLCGDAALRRSLGAANAEKALAEYSATSMAAQYDTLFRSMIRP